MVTRKYERDNSLAAGLITAVLHAGVLLGALFIYFNAPAPAAVVEDMGVSVNYGTADAGTGNTQPTVATAPGPTTVQNFDHPAESTNPTPNPAQPPNPTPAAAAGGEKVATQNFEDAPVSHPSESNTGPSTVTAATSAAPARSANPRAILGGKRNLPGNTGNEGTGGGTGDQGKPNGDPNSTNRDGNGGGHGDIGTGFSLTGRTYVTRPNPPSDNSRAEGKITVRVWVDRNGKVVRAETSLAGTNISNSALQNKCEQAALTAKFNPNSEAQEEQVGNIYFVFKNQ